MYRLAISRMALDKKIPPGDPTWPQFNGSFDNLSLDHIDIANAVYTGHAFTTWHRNHWRNAANYELGQHIGLDFDAGDASSSLPVLAKDKFILRYASMLYATPSSTPDAPRSRALFVLDTPIYQAKNYVAAASALLWLFGTADRQCKDACRFFYGSINCDIELLGNVLPLTKVKELIAQYQATGAHVKRHHESRIVGTTDQREVADALRHIDPWAIDYDDWLRVLMAIHREYGDAGLGLAESWASGAPGEVERKWKSFTANGNATGAVSLGTVFTIAKQKGWQRRLAA